MLEQVLENLRASSAGSFLDCTFGGGGHSQAILNANPENKLLAIDRDPVAIERAALLKEEKRFGILKTDFEHMFEAIKNNSDAKFDGVLADLGLSMDQLKTNRGFSFRDQNLDMRMDLQDSSTSSAEDLLNNAAEHDLFVILRKGGVQKEAKKIASAIVRARPIATAQQLANLIASLHLAQDRKSGSAHSATVVFQAIRMSVNREIENINALLDAVPKLVNPNARFCVITFHSLEDELITAKMRSWHQGCTCPAGHKCECGQTKLGTLLTRKPIEPTDLEIEKNPSSRSSRLRVFEFSQEIN